MKNIYSKVIALFFIIALFGLLSPQVSFAGALKDKLQKRINAPSNIQLQQYDINKEADAGKIQEFESQEKRRAIPDVLYSYAIYQTDYKAELEENVVTVKGEVLFEVFKEGWTKLPLVRSDVGLIDVSVNKGSSFVVMQGNRYYLMIDKPGRYNLNIEFLIKAAREREGGPGSFSFDVMPAPISQFEFTLPEPDVQIFVEPAIKVELKTEPRKTVAWAVMPNTENINVRWTKALPREELTPVKLEPKVYLDTATYASVGEGVIRCQSSLDYSILQSEISNPRLVMPEDVNVLEVSGKDLRDWKVHHKDNLQYLDVYLNFGVKGKYVLNVTYERNIGEGSVAAEVPWLRALDVEREKGYIGVAASTNVELAANELEHVTAVDVKELPSSIWHSTANPILLAFKYLNHPFAINIDVTRHEELPILVAAIDSANYTTLVTDDGKILTKVTYQARNNVKQFLRLTLPENATLWSSFVADKPVKPAKDKNGSILIPLEKSQLQGESIAQFPVEIVYLDNGPKMNLAGRLKLSLPQTDIPVSELYWAAYLPIDYRYSNFGGNVRPTRRGVSMPVLSRAKMVSRKEEIRQFTPPQEAFFGQVDELQKKGVLPIKINIPQQGRLFNFSKLLVTEKDTPWLSATYLSMFKKAQGAFWFLIILIIIGFLFKKFRHRV